MNRKRLKWVRILAAVLAILLVLSAIVSMLLSFAYSEEAVPESRNHQTLTMEYLGEEQALRMSQRLVYTNTSDQTLDRVLFYAPANLLRRQSTLPYEGETLASAFPMGYLPGGIELASVQVDGTAADWGYQGEGENYLRVSCMLEPGEQCTFEWNYYLLLTENEAFLGVSAEGWQLSNFYFTPAALDESGEFILNAPLSWTRYIDTPAADFEVEISLPDSCLLAATGTESCTQSAEHVLTWHISADNVRDFSLAFGRRYRESSVQTDSGVQLRCLTNVRGIAQDVLNWASEAVEICEKWFGPMPFEQLDFVQAGCASGALNHSASLWLSEEMLTGDTDALAHAIRRFVAMQYFGYTAYAHPSSDAWLSDSICEYLSYLMLEEEKGYESYIALLNENVVPSLQLTIPGGLNLTSDAALFTGDEYKIIILDRGAAVFHELYTAMGRDDLIQGLRLFYEKGLNADVLTEMDLVDALDEASGKSWESFLTDWVFNIGDYVNQSIDWLE